MLEFWRDICSYQEYDFSQELHVYFSQTMPGLILYELQQHGFVGIDCVCLTGLPAEENQTMATMDCWAAQVFYTPRMGKKSKIKSVTRDVHFRQKMQSVIAHEL